jgi:hypothetical protein
MLRRVAFLTCAVVLALGSVSLPSSAKFPQINDESSIGNNYSVMLMQFPDTCPVNAAMRGVYVVRRNLPSNATVNPPTSALVKFNVVMETAAGPVTIFAGRFWLRAGQARGIPLEIPVEAGTPLGPAYFSVTSVMSSERLDVGHHFEVTP